MRKKLFNDKIAFLTSIGPRFWHPGVPTHWHPGVPKLVFEI